MANTPLLNFDAVKDLEGELANIQTSFKKNDPGYIPSQYNKDWATQRVPNRTCLVLYHHLRNYLGRGTRKLFVSTTDKGGYIAEVKDATETHLCYARKEKNEWNLYACVMDNATGAYTPYEFEQGKRRGTVLLTSLLPEILSDAEAESLFSDMETYLKMKPDSQDWKFGNNLEEFSILLSRFSDNVYRRMTSPDRCGSAGIDVALRGFNNGVQVLRQEMIKKLKADTVYVGTPTVFQLAQQKMKTKAYSAYTDFKGKYVYDKGRILSDEEKHLIPEIKGWYEMPEFVPKLCARFMASTRFPAPMRTVLLVGPAGTGKTEAARTIACGIGLPYDHITCSEQTEIFDFLGQIFPNGNQKQSISFDDIRKEMHLPSTEDIINDPQDCYEAVMGIPCVGIAQDSVLIREMVKKVMEKAEERFKNNKDFSYIEGGLIRAARLGYCFEVQEIGSVKRPGVVVGLNALLESGDNNFITLPTGETIKKHPDCTIVFTSNSDYEGCQNLNQAVLSRMSMVQRIENPEANTMVDRINNRIHFPEQVILERMVKVVKQIEEYTREHDISDGVCGPRELENWAMEIVIESELQNVPIDDELVRECANDTILNKVSQVVENIEEVAAACVDKEFGD